MAAQLSSTGISHHSLLPHIPSICLSAVNSIPHPGIAPHFPNSSSQPLRLLGDPRPCAGYDLRPCLGYVWHGCGKDCLILIPFRLPQISCFTLSLKCFSSDSDNCPRCGGWTPASVPSPAEGRPSPTNTPVSPPTSFILPSFTCFYIFFSFGQVLLLALNWCSACTSV